MPTTVNGVGTHYYGNSNRSVRSGVCRSCGATAQLESYDTRLWFVILFIPIIPLGRKRIIDQCGRCMRHFVADRAKYEMARQLSVSGVLEQYRSQPTPETALQVHASLLSFQMHAEADKFRAAALQEHADSAELHAGLALHLEQVDRPDEARPLLEKAYCLQPDLPEARVGMARIKMAQGKLPEARELLNFLAQPGAGKLYSLEPLEMLARHYQKQGQHEETLTLCKHLIDELPHVGRIPVFRNYVAASERALNCRESILPAQPFSLRQRLFSSERRQGSWLSRLVWLAVIVGGVLLTATCLNEYWRRHGRVVALNECGLPLQMAIDDNPPETLLGTKFLALAEGAHHVKISGPIQEEFDIQMGCGYFDRFVTSPAWVIMAGRGTVLLSDAVHYAANNPRPSDVTVVCGEHFYYARHVDFCFTAPPQSIQVDQKSGELTKVYLHAATEPSHELIQAVAAKDLSAALDFAETRLVRDSDDAQLLALYSGIAEVNRTPQRALAYLKTGLDRRPLCLAWHRAYQDAGKIVGQQAEMEKQYDALLQKSPRDAGLMYLAGRVAADRKRSHELFLKSHDTDPRLFWPCIALAFDASSRGDWPTCRQMAQAAVALQGDYPGAQGYLREARLALGEFDDLERESRQAMSANDKHDPLDSVIELCEVLVMRNKRDEAIQTLNDWLQSQPAREASAQGDSWSRNVVDYMAGKFLEKPDGRNGDAAKFTSAFQLHSLLAGGHVKEALGDESLKESLAEPWNALAVSVAWGLLGNRDEACAWREKSAAALDRLDSESKRAAALLRAAQPSGNEELENLVLITQNKCLLIAALIQRFPEQKPAMAPLAEKLNVGRHPPYHLVRRAIELTAAAPEAPSKALRPVNEK